MECVICNKNFENNILFEDDKIIIMLAVEPSVNGHIQIFPKEHHTILEQVPPEILNLMVNAANKISIILFELLKVHGTNIIVNNGVPAGQKIPHVSIDILPRRTEDNLKLDWTLKQAPPEALDSIHRIIEEGMSKSDIIAVTDEKKEEFKKEIKEEKVEESNDQPREKKTNYYQQLFERTP